MGDPITAGLQLFCSALSAASAVAEYADKSDIRKEKRAERARIAARNAAPPAQITGFEPSLPPGWETRKTKTGEVCYVNHSTKKWTFTRPASKGTQPIPKGWEMKTTAGGRIYFYNTKSKTTTWHLSLPPGCNVDSKLPITQELSPEREKTTTATQTLMDESTSLEELFLVLGTLGQRLIALGVIVQTELPSSHKSVSRSISIVAKGLFKEFRELPMALQYSITCAIVFCTACYPMHIYRGFGCGVLDNTFWGMHPDDTQYPDVHRSSHLTAMDKVLAFRKSLPDTVRLLKKIPIGVDSELPRFEPFTGEALEQIAQMCEDLTLACRKNFPKPKDPRIVINSWSVHLATWQGNAIYDSNCSMRELVTHQCDPGRMLYGWIVWNRLNLRPGQAAYISDDHTSHLAMWLEGLEGMTFKVMPDEELDYSHMEYTKELSQLFMETTGNPHGQTGIPSIIILDPKLPKESARCVANSLSNLTLESNIGSVKYLPSNAAAPVTRRRPPPPPPRIVAPRQVMAKHDFKSTDAEELGFAVGQVLEIVDDKRNDGWWVAKLSAKTGLIPRSYVDEICW